MVFSVKKKNTFYFATAGLSNKTKNVQKLYLWYRYTSGIGLLFYEIAIIFITFITNLKYLR
jgi:hypothetical protein